MQKYPAHYHRSEEKTAFHPGTCHLAIVRCAALPGGCTLLAPVEQRHVVYPAPVRRPAIVGNRERITVFGHLT